MREQSYFPCDPTSSQCINVGHRGSVYISPGQWAYTSEVKAYDPDTGIFMTENTIYIPSMHCMPEDREFFKKPKDFVNYITAHQLTTFKRRYNVKD